jgi:hypothetical protein
LYKRVTKKKFVCFQSLLKLHNKSSYGASGFCENYTRKTPLYIYYLISKSANAACIILAFWYYVSVLNRVRATKERRTEHKRMNRTQCAGRSRWQYCRRWRRGITPGEKFKCKGMNKLKFVYRCFIVGAVIMAGFLLSALIR